MEAQVMLLRESTPAAELAARAISSVVNGEVDPITAHINISRMEAAIKLFKENHLRARHHAAGACQIRQIASVRRLPTGGGRIGRQVRLFDVRRQPAERYVQDAGSPQGRHQGARGDAEKTTAYRNGRPRYGRGSFPSSP